MALTFLAAATSRIRLAFGVLVLPQRHPVLLAKQLASLDVLAAGRLIIGVGAGYVEPELEALGVPITTLLPGHSKISCWPSCAGSCGRADCSSEPTPSTPANSMSSTAVTPTSPATPGDMPTRLRAAGFLDARVELGELGPSRPSWNRKRFRFRAAAP